MMSCDVKVLIRSKNPRYLGGLEHSVSRLLWVKVQLKTKKGKTSKIVFTLGNKSDDLDSLDVRLYMRTGQSEPDVIQRK